MRPATHRDPILPTLCFSRLGARVASHNFRTSFCVSICVAFVFFASARISETDLESLTKRPKSSLAAKSEPHQSKQAQPSVGCGGCRAMYCNKCTNKQQLSSVPPPPSFASIGFVSDAPESLVISSGVSYVLTRVLRCYVRAMTLKSKVERAPLFG